MKIFFFGIRNLTAEKIGLYSIYKNCFVRYNNKVSFGGRVLGSLC